MSVYLLKWKLFEFEFGKKWPEYVVSTVPVQWNWKYITLISWWICRHWMHWNLFGNNSRCSQWWKIPWWRHQVEKFSTLLALCEENSPVTSEFSSQKPVTQSFDVFFDLHLNCWEHNRNAGDSRRHRAHYDVTEMNQDLISYIDVIHNVHMSIHCSIPDGQ